MNINDTRAWLAASIRLGVMLLLGCLAQGAAAQKPAAPTAGTIKVGVLHSLSGTMAISETTLKDTVLMMIDEQNQLGGLLGKKLGPELRKAALDRIERAGSGGVPPPILESCLIDPEVTPELNCEQKWLPAEVEAFRGELFPVLEKLACESSAIARGLIRGLIQQIDPSETSPTAISSGRFGLAGRFAALLDKRECEGLGSLPEADKNRIRDLARREDELRAQSSAGKPMKEVPTSPTPPPAAAPATP